MGVIKVRMLICQNKNILDGATVKVREPSDYRTFGIESCQFLCRTRPTNLRTTETSE